MISCLCFASHRSALHRAASQLNAPAMPSAGVHPPAFGMPLGVRQRHATLRAAALRNAPQLNSTSESCRQPVSVVGMLRCPPAHHSATRRLATPRSASHRNATQRIDQAVPSVLRDCRDALASAAQRAAAPRSAPQLASTQRIDPSHPACRLSRRLPGCLGIHSAASLRSASLRHATPRNSTHRINP